MTGEKDPRDVMQAEHDARLSEHPAFRAPAEMPGVEEIADLVVKHRWDDAWDETTAKAILALFAPILAENEAYRQNRHFVMGFNAGFEAACEQGLGAAAIRAQGE